jgi:hypothetical protein
MGISVFFPFIPASPYFCNAPAPWVLLPNIKHSQNVKNKVDHFVKWNETPTMLLYGECYCVHRVYGFSSNPWGETAKSIKKPFYELLIPL